MFSFEYQHVQPFGKWEYKKTLVKHLYKEKRFPCFVTKGSVLYRFSKSHQHENFVLYNG